MNSIVLLTALLGTVYCQNVSVDTSNHFSLPPSNLPVKKIYVHGRPVYVRQTFVNPLRDGGSHTFGGFSNGVNAYVPAPPVSAVPQAVYEQPPPLPPVVPSGYENAEVDNTPKNNYPLPECYTNDHGFMCCNPALETAINNAYNELKKSRKTFSTCNIQQIANKVQSELESTFNTQFEAITGVGDYASKSHFYHNYICKIERDNRFILAYATPRDLSKQGGSGSEKQYTYVWRK